jgi:acyl-coenzyme A thioesterase PaaI-like protein
VPRAPHPVGDWLGLDYEAAGDGGRLLARFVPDPARHRGAPGYLHGGVAATALDETMAAACYLSMGLRFVTATLQLRYRRPVPLDGRPVTVEAWADGGGRRRRAQGRLLLADGAVAVEASGIFVATPTAMREVPG